MQCLSPLAVLIYKPYSLILYFLFSRMELLNSREAVSLDLHSDTAEAVMRVWGCHLRVSPDACTPLGSPELNGNSVYLLYLKHRPVMQSLDALALLWLIELHDIAIYRSCVCGCF